MPDPIARAQAWLEEAAAAGVPEPDGAALATASPDGHPSVRFVLVRGVDDRGLRFFTNYGSRKGRELDANPSPRSRCGGRRCSARSAPRARSSG